MSIFIVLTFIVSFSFFNTFIPVRSIFFSKESFIFKEVDKFINDFRKEIISVEEITEYEAWQDFPNIHDQFENA